MLSTAFLTLALSASSSYDDASLHAFVAVASDRVVDGVLHSRGPLASAGLMFVHPGGLFVNSALSRFDSNGAYLPADSQQVLESAAGWQWRGQQQSLSLALHDYRYTEKAHSSAYASAPTRVSYQGVTLQYAYRNWRAEFGVDRDQPYYYAGGGVASHDVQRIALAWSTTPGDGLEWFGGAGALLLDDRELLFASAGVRGQWLGLEWQLMASHSHARNFPVPAAATGGQVLIRIARTFRLAGD